MIKLSRKIKTLFVLAVAGVTTLSTVSETFALDPEESKYTYVSLGDSMTTGFGFDDYYVDDDPDAVIKDVDWANEDGNKCVRGFLTSAQKSYPSLIKEYLEDQKGEGNVEWIQLAQNASRVDDIYFDLIQDSAQTDQFHQYCFASSGDGLKERWNDIFGERARDKGLTTETDNDVAVGDAMRKSIAKADLITLCTGFNNFGSFISGKIESIIEGIENVISYHFGGNDTLQELFDRIGYDIDVQGIYDEVVNILNNSIGINITAYEDFAFGSLTLHVKRLLELIVYTCCSYCYYFDQLTQYIREINPTAEFVVIVAFNAIKGIKLDFGSFVVDLEEIFGYLFEFANLQAALLCKEADTYKFVDAHDLDVQLHIDDLSNGTLDAEQAKRAYSGVYSLARQFGINESVLPSFSTVVNQINSNIGGGFDLRNYLPGDKKDSTVYQSNWHIDAADLGGNTEAAALINAGLDEYYAGISSMINVLARASNHSTLDITAIEAFASQTAVPDIMNDESLDGLLNIFIRAILNNGMWNHPNEEGHQAIAAATIRAIERDVTARQTGFKMLARYTKNAYEAVEPVLEDFVQQVYDFCKPYVDAAIDGAYALAKQAVETVTEEIRKGVVATKEAIRATVQSFIDLTNCVRDANIAFINSVIDALADSAAKRVLSTIAIYTGLASFAVGGLTAIVAAEAAAAVAMGLPLVAEGYRVIGDGLVALNLYLANALVYLGNQAGIALTNTGMEFSNYFFTIVLGLDRNVDGLMERLEAATMSAFVVYMNAVGDVIDDLADKAGSFASRVAEATAYAAGVVANTAMFVESRVYETCAKLVSFAKGCTEYVISISNAITVKTFEEIGRVISTFAAFEDFRYGSVYNFMEAAEAFFDSRTSSMFAFLNEFNQQAASYFDFFGSILTYLRQAIDEVKVEAALNVGGVLADYIEARIESMISALDGFEDTARIIKGVVEMSQDALESVAMMFMNVNRMILDGAVNTAEAIAIANARAFELLSIVADRAREAMTAMTLSVARFAEILPIAIRGGLDLLGLASAMLMEEVKETLNTMVIVAPFVITVTGTVEAIIAAKVATRFAILKARLNAALALDTIEGIFEAIHILAEIAEIRAEITGSIVAETIKAIHDVTALSIEAVVTTNYVAGKIVYTITVSTVSVINNNVEYLEDEIEERVDEYVDDLTAPDSSFTAMCEGLEAAKEMVSNDIETAVAQDKVLLGKFGSFFSDIWAKVNARFEAEEE